MESYGPFPSNILGEVLKLPGNNKCCDCPSLDTDWGSVSHGTLLCLHCAGKHRALGVHISFVRSIHMDTWSQQQIEMMRQGGNTQIRDFFKRLQIENSPITTLYSTKGATHYRSKLKERVQKVLSGEISPDRKNQINTTTYATPTKTKEIANKIDNKKVKESIITQHIVFGPGSMGMTITKDYRGGAVVSKLVPQGAAQEKGVKLGDTVIGVAGKALQDFDEIMHMIPCMIRPLQLTFARVFKEEKPPAISLMSPSLPIAANSPGFVKPQIDCSRELHLHSTTAVKSPQNVKIKIKTPTSKAKAQITTDSDSDGESPKIVKLKRGKKKSVEASPEKDDQPSATEISNNVSNNKDSNEITDSDATKEDKDATDDNLVTRSSIDKNEYKSNDAAQPLEAKDEKEVKDDESIIEDIKNDQEENSKVGNDIDEECNEDADEDADEDEDDDDDEDDGADDDNGDDDDDDGDDDDDDDDDDDGDDDNNNNDGDDNNNNNDNDGDDNNNDDDDDGDDDNDNETETVGKVTNDIEYNAQNEQEESTIVNVSSESTSIVHENRDNDDDKNSATNDAEDDEDDEEYFYLRPGTSVKVLKKDKWRSATIKREHKDGTYKVGYKDNTTESHVSIDRIAITRKALQRSNSTIMLEAASEEIFSSPSLSHDVSMVDLQINCEDDVEVVSQVFDDEHEDFVVRGSDSLDAWMEDDNPSELQLDKMKTTTKAKDEIKSPTALTNDRSYNPHQQDINNTQTASVGADFRVIFAEPPLGLTLTKNFSGGAEVTKLVLNGQAQQFGVSVGDVLIGVGSQWVRGYDDAMVLLSDRQYPKGLVFRRGLKRTIAQTSATVIRGTQIAATKIMNTLGIKKEGSLLRSAAQRKLSNNHSMARRETSPHDMNRDDIRKIKTTRNELKREPDANEFDVVFEEGEIGARIEERDGQYPVSVVTAVADKGQAMNKGVTYGCIVIGINYERFISHAHTISSLKHAKRPVIVRFKSPS